MTTSASLEVGLTETVKCGQVKWTGRIQSLYSLHLYVLYQGVKQEFTRGKTEPYENEQEKSIRCISLKNTLDILD